MENEEAFSRLYEQHCPGVFRFFYYRTCDRQTSEDLTSTVFFKALGRIRLFDAERGTFQGWLYRIAHNTLIDHFRTQRQTDNIEDIPEMSDGGDIERDVSARQAIAGVRKKLADLPTDQQNIVLMRAWDDLSYKEIAEATGKSEESCRMAFSRAIKKISSSL